MRIHDGAMGTRLLDQLAGDETVDDLCVRAPQLVRAVHASYLEAGADVIQTNSFLVWMRDSTRRRRMLIEASLDCARQAVADSARAVDIAGTLGPAGDDPRAYWRDIEAWLERDVRLLRVETVVSRAVADAVLAAWRDVARGVDDACLLLGCTVAPSAGPDAVRWVSELASDVPGDIRLGLNCCEGPDGLRGPLEALVEARGEDAVWVDPSAGVGAHVAPRAWADAMRQLAEGLPLLAIGGCCGTTPDGIAYLRDSIGT